MTDKAIKLTAAETQQITALHEKAMATFERTGNCVEKCFHCGDVILFELVSPTAIKSTCTCGRFTGISKVFSPFTPPELKYDDLEYTAAGVYLLNGIPFSGIAREFDSQGKRVCEIPIVAGKQHGLTRGFFPDGRTKGETPYNAGKRHGIEKEWFDTGQVKAENTFEFGILMKSQEWTPDGQLVKEYLRPPTDFLYQQVEKARQSEAAKP